MNALDVLRQQHRQIRQFLQQAQATSDDDDATRKQIYAHLSEVLHLHEHLEEKLFYPELKRRRATQRMAARSFDEHHLADVRLRELEAAPARQHAWGEALDRLAIALEAHIGREEDELFPAAKIELGEERLDLMGNEMINLSSPPKEKAA